ncbi:hypothetical protein ACIA8E_32540 [Streptomyces sp. NPDC051664]|uniref:hypothetical protein n=1 Tax=Streptomyces sp. NPDC051664 TaxID=3365668 RepID=UPI0037913553
MDAALAEVSPRVVVNASSGGADWAVTAEGPVRLATAAARSGSHLVHVSSDAVFSVVISGESTVLAGQALAWS